MILLKALRLYGLGLVFDTARNGSSKILPKVGKKERYNMISCSVSNSYILLASFAKVLLSSSHSFWNHNLFGLVQEAKSLFFSLK